MNNIDGLRLFETQFKEMINSQNRNNEIRTTKECLDYYISTSMTNIRFRKIIESTSISNFDHSLPPETIKYLLNNKLIDNTTLPEFANGSFITIKGLATLLYEQDQDIEDILTTFESIDKLKLPKEELKLKKEELLLVVLFLSCNAINESQALIENNSFHSKIIYDRLIQIEDELHNILPNFLANRIDFTKGKKVSWTRFLGEINNLSKTGIYIKNNKESKSSYYLNLDNIKSINYLFKLSFSHLDTHEKILLGNYIAKNNIKIQIGMPNQVSKKRIPENILNKFKV